MLETTTLTIAELTEKYHKPSIAICATNDKFDIFNHHRVTAMFNTFIEMPKTYTDFKMGLQIRHYTVQALRLLKTTANGIINKKFSSKNELNFLFIIFHIVLLLEQYR